MFNCLQWMSFQNSCLAFSDHQEVQQIRSPLFQVKKKNILPKKERFLRRYGLPGALSSLVWTLWSKQMLCSRDPPRDFVDGSVPGVLRLYHARVQAVYMWPYLNLWFYRRERESKQTKTLEQSTERRWTTSWSRDIPFTCWSRVFHPSSIPSCFVGAFPFKHVLTNSPCKSFFCLAAFDFLPSQHISPFCRRRSLCLMRVVQ